MNLVTAGNSVKRSKPTGKGYHNNAVFKERLNKKTFLHKKVVRPHGCVCTRVGGECVSESTFCRCTLKITKVVLEQEED